MNKKNIDPKFGGINARPGMAQNMTVEDVVKFIRNQKKAKGFRFTLSTGTNEDLEINLPGNAKMMMGIAFNSGSAPLLRSARCKFEVNNEIILDNISCDFMGAEFTDEGYYFIPRPLSGQDDISISLREVSDAGDLDVIVYYI